MSSAKLLGTLADVTSLEQELIQRLGDETVFVSMGAWLIPAVTRSSIQNALAELTERHEVLRPTGTSASARPEVEWRDWTLDERDVDLRVRAAFEEIRTATHTRHASPPLRVVIAEIAPDKNVLMLAAPALYADRRGLRNIAAEIVALCLQTASRHGERPLQYAQYAAVRRELLMAPENSQGRTYWTGRTLAGDSRAILLGKTRPNPSGPFAPRTLYRRLAEPALLAAGKLARSRAVSLEALLLASYHALLWRLGANPPLLTGVGFSGRHLEILSGMPGAFERHVPIRSDTTELTTPAQLMQEIHEALSEAGSWVDQFDWTYVRDAGGLSDPLCYQFGFSWFEEADERPVPILEYNCQDRFELNLTCSNYGDHLQLEWQYNSAFYSETDACRTAHCWENLLAGFCQHPDAEIADLEITGRAEQAQASGVDTPGDGRASETCIHEWIEEQTNRTPDALAVVSPAGSLTYRELDNRARDVAGYLRTLRVGPDRTVAVFCKRSQELIVGILAVLKAGGAYVPIDPRTPAHRLAFILRDANVCAVLSEQDSLERIPTGTYATIPIDAVLPDSQPDARSLMRNAVPDNLAYIIYTSGSTGTPKGVGVSHRNLVNSTRARHAFYSSGVSCFLLLSSAAFDSSVAGIFGTLTQGGVLLLGPADFPAGLSELPDTILRHRVSHMLCLPTVWADILDRAPREALTSLECVIVAGEACSPELVEKHGAMLPAVPLVNEYGPTECTVWATAGLLSGKAHGDPVTIGRAISGGRVYVLNRGLRCQPAGVAGELCIGGSGVARGYLNQPALTAERFIPDQYSDEPGARMYRSGDRAQVHGDGEIELLGRLDDQIKIRGHRIEPAEIELQLCRHRAIREAVVVSRDDAHGNPRLVAYYVLSGDEYGHAGADLRRNLTGYLRERLPDHMIPSIFVPLDRLPVNINGKVDRRALPEPDPDLTRAPYTAPRGELESRVASLWSEILKTDLIGAHDNFFDLGGHSLLAVRLHERLCQEFDPEIRLIDIFEHSTVSALALYLSRRTEPRTAVPDGDGAWAANRRLAFARRRAQAVAAD